MERLPGDSRTRRAVQRALAILAALALTLTFFLLLPVIQAIGTDPGADLDVRAADTASLPPPPPPPIEEPEPEEEPEEEPPPPEMLEEAPPLDLAQLDLALNAGLGGGDGWMSTDFALQLNVLGGDKGGDADSIFGLDDLDQKPRVTYQASPLVNDKIRKKAPGTVYVLFVVGPDGRVEEPKIQTSTDPIFEAPALSAVKKWRFEPGRKNGEAVRFRMRVPITFPAP